MIESNRKIIKNKVGLLNLAEQLGNVSRACKVMGFSRDTFYRYKSAFEEGGVEALLDASRRKPNMRNRVDEAIEKEILYLSFEYPAYGQVRIKNELAKKGMKISPCGVRCVWLRHNLETIKKRLKYVEEKVAQKGGVLTENQLQAVERFKQSQLAHGEIETEHPGYLGSQDTFYVGTLKGVGRVYQQTYVDTYTKVAHCKLYQMKTPITAADLLNDRVLPFYEQEDLGVLRVLTDRGTEFCGKAESHEYELYLAVNDIDHTKTKTRHPQTNGICERFHKTILQEFYQVTFRKKIYSDIETLQKDLDEWLYRYNYERTHQGKMCNGRTPIQTLKESKYLWDEKVGQINKRTDN